jgi:hypothetical protein
LLLFTVFWLIFAVFEPKPRPTNQPINILGFASD